MKGERQANYASPKVWDKKKYNTKAWSLDVVKASGLVKFMSQFFSIPSNILVAHLMVAWRLIYRPSNMLTHGGCCDTDDEAYYIYSLIQIVSAHNSFSEAEAITHLNSGRL